MGKYKLIIIFFFFKTIQIFTAHVKMPLVNPPKWVRNYNNWLLTTSSPKTYVELIKFIKRMEIVFEGSELSYGMLSRHESVYGVVARSSFGTIYEMTSIGKKLPWFEGLKNFANLLTETRGEHQSIDLPRWFKNAPPKYIIVKPDGEEDVIYWGDRRGISGWLADRRKEIYERHK